MIRRRQLGRLCGSGLLALPLAGCGSKVRWHNINISSSTPPLAFSMTRATDARLVTQADYRGDITLLYFGYTLCPDVCPTTLANIAAVLKHLGPLAAHVQVLFVTVDPNRDTLPMLKRYTALFAPQIVGLRGTPNQLASMARRYRVVYSVHPATKTHPYEVTHSSAIYVFDATGAARLLVPSMSSTSPDIAGTVADLRRLIRESHPPGLLARIMRMV
ncbi:MAG TPA: SCO family protein [Rhodanobacter sp.]|nr:SCO family protein [Rhodanobacter sp.]